VKTSKILSAKMIRNKALVEIEKKLHDRLLDLEVQRCNGLKNAPLIIGTGKNARKTLKKLPLSDKELEQFERILSGNDELEKLDDRFTDYMIHLEQIQKRRLKLYRLNDHADYSHFKYIGPDGTLHKKPSANPKSDTNFCKKIKKQRISNPRTVRMKTRNNTKRVRYVELLGKHTGKKQQNGTFEIRRNRTSCTSHDIATSRPCSPSCYGVAGYVPYSPTEGESTQPRIPVA